ncbi:MAG: TOBE domain-containing protein [Cyclobacteriaceae bacterium]
MNILEGKIKAIKVDGHLSLVRIEVGTTVLTSIVIDTPATASYLAPQHAVKVIFKETEVMLGKGTEHPISLQNRLIGRVKSIESGQLLSKLVLDTSAGSVTSIITTNAVKQLELTEGAEVTAMIKTNEMMLSA